MKYIDRSGIHYGFRTSPAFGGPKHYAEIVKSANKTYGKHTAHGARTVRKPFCFIPLGQFESKTAAVEAAKQWLQKKFENPD